MSRLLDALRRAEEARDRSRGIVRPPSENPAPAPAPAPPRAPAIPRQPLLAIAIALAIFLATGWAWHSQPLRAPVKGKIDATPLKLDRELKMKREPPAAPAPGGTPRP